MSFRRLIWQLLMPFSVVLSLSNCSNSGNNRSNDESTTTEPYYTEQDLKEIRVRAALGDLRAIKLLLNKADFSDNRYDMFLWNKRLYHLGAREHPLWNLPSDIESLALEKSQSTSERLFLLHEARHFLKERVDWKISDDENRSIFLLNEEIRAAEEKLKEQSPALSQKVEKILSNNYGEWLRETVAQKSFQHTKDLMPAPAAPAATGEK